LALAGHSAGCRITAGSVAYTSIASVCMLQTAIYSACNFITIFCH